MHSGFFLYQLCVRRDKLKNKFRAMMRLMNTTKHTLFLLEVTSFRHLLPCNFYLQSIYIYFITLRCLLIRCPAMSFVGIYRNRPINNVDFHTYSIE